MKSPRAAVSTVFFLHGLAGGMWIARIPAVQENLGLSMGALGLALLGGGLGSLLALLGGGGLVARYGSRQIALWVPLPACTALALLALASNWLTLFVALVLWGATASVLDVAMNTQGSAIEQRRARPIMSSLHGLWSIGSMSGAALATLVSGLGLSVRAHLLVAAPLLLLALALAARPFETGDNGHQTQPVFAWPRGDLLALAVLVFCAVGIEGAMYDWGGVFLQPWPRSALARSSWHRYQASCSRVWWRSAWGCPCWCRSSSLRPGVRQSCHLARRSRPSQLWVTPRF
ncbi:MAG: MFS transporter [Chloroflexi bacterium]|nr:MFS transporter [Chloroflexota bacterium]